MMEKQIEVVEIQIVSECELACSCQPDSVDEKISEFRGRSEKSLPHKEETQEGRQDKQVQPHLLRSQKGDRRVVHRLSLDR